MKNLKKISSFGILFLATILFLSSCSKPPKSLNAIPEDTNFVTAIDVKSLAVKGKLNKLKDLNLYKTFSKEIKNEDKKTYKLINNIIDDPSITGINFFKDFFVYYIDDSKKEKFVCFSVELNDKEKFEKFLKDLSKKYKSDFKLDIEEHKNYSYSVQGKSAIGWDDDKALIIFATNYKSRKKLDDEIEKLLTLKDDEQITSNDKFNAFYKDKKDISVWYSTDLLIDKYTLRSMQKAFDIDMTGIFYSFFLNFNDDNISIVSRFIPNEDIKKMMDKYNIWDKKFNPELLKYLPEKSYIAASIAINPVSYYEMLIKSNENFEKIEEAAKKEGWDIEAILNEVNGSAVFSLYDIDEIEYQYTGYKSVYNPKKYKHYNEYTKSYEYKEGYDYEEVEKTAKRILPLMGFVFDLNGNKQIKKLLDNIPERNMKKHNDYYEFLDGIPVYFAYNDNFALITNDKKTVEAFGNGGYSDSLKDADFSSNMTGSHLYALINLNFNDYPEKFIKMLHYNDGGLKIWNKIAKNIEVKTVDKNTAEFKFNIKKGDGNSLNTIITIIDENYESLMH